MVSQFLQGLNPLEIGSYCNKLTEVLLKYKIHCLNPLEIGSYCNSNKCTLNNDFMDICEKDLKLKICLIILKGLFSKSKTP